jgi:hypothetical protein
MMKSPRAAGGFLWSFHDEGVVRGDRHDSIDIAGNQAPDGIVGPHREKEASYYTIKQLWSPVQADTCSVAGRLAIAYENRYLYTDLRECRFEWKLVSFPEAGEKGAAVKVLQNESMVAPGLAPGGKNTLMIPVSDYSKADAMYFFVFKGKDTICSWSWALHSPGEGIDKETAVVKGAGTDATETTNSITVACDGISYRFDKETGFLDNVVNSKGHISLRNGPALAGSGAQVLTELRHSMQGNQYIVEPLYRGDSLRVKWIFRSGYLPKLEYSYLAKDTVDYMGISFDYPEAYIKGMKWMGRGPYRVWKNRLKGQQFGVWEKAYNNTITGETWDYPEFKGWHSELYWVKLQNKESDFIVYTDRPGIFLEMGKPENPKGAGNNNTSPLFPEGNIGFMHAISPIGTKFQRPEVMGPQSERTVPLAGVPLTGALYFDFR